MRGAQRPALVTGGAGFIGSHLVDGLVRALDGDLGFVILNLGAGRTVSVLEVIEELERALDVKARIEWLPQQVGDVSRTWADISAARGNGGPEGGVVLELDSGRLLVGTPVDPAVVRAMAAVRRDLSSRGRSWQELDGRFRGWVVVRGGARAAPAAVVSPKPKRRGRSTARAA